MHENYENRLKPAVNRCSSLYTSQQENMKAVMYLTLGALLPVVITSTQCVDKTWIFGVATDIVPAADPTQDTGEIMKHSFEKALIPAVCKIAHKKCKIVGVQIADIVVNHRGRLFPGNGLLSGHFDAGVQFIPTEERLAAMKFSYPYAQPSKTGFFVLHGNPHHFNPHGGDFTVGVINGQFAGPQCLNRNKKIFTKVVSLFALDVVDAVKSGEVDAVFLELEGREDKTGLEQLGNTFTCVLAGLSVITRKDSELTSWWNPAFKELAHSGQYHHICKKVKDADYRCFKNIKKEIKKFDKNPLLSHRSNNKSK